MICKECSQPTDRTVNDRCWECHQIAQEKWQKKMAVRQDPVQFDPAKLIGYLLSEHWMHECKIIPDYMPPYPHKDTRPTCQVQYTYEDGSKTFLRYSNGPLQGYFWDVYGDDMHSPELALVAISQASPPTRVGVVVPTHGR